MAAEQAGPVKPGSVVTEIEEYGELALEISGTDGKLTSSSKLKSNLFDQSAFSSGIGRHRGAFLNTLVQR